MLQVLAFIILSLISVILIYKYITNKLGNIIRNVTEQIFVALCLNVILISCISLLLVIFKIYSLVSISLVLLLTNVILFLYSKKIKTQINLHSREKFDKYSVIIVVIFVIAALLYFSFPTQYLLGGRDSGLYSVFGVQISNTGHLDLTDKFLEDELYPYLKDSIILGYPGIYSAMDRNISESPGVLIPQFLHLFSALLAVGYDLFGMQGMLRVNAFIGLLALGAIFIFTKQLGNRLIAILALVFMLVNPAQLWNVRITLTETFSQFLLMFSMYLLIIAIKSKQIQWFVLSGVILGLGGLNRIDSHIFAIGVLFFVAYSLFTNKHIKGTFAYFISYLIMAIYSIYYAYHYSYPYFYDLWHSGTLKYLIYMNVVSLITIVVSFIVYIIVVRMKINFILTKRLFIYLKRNVAIISMSVLFLLIIFALFIRPHLINIDTDISSPLYFNANALEQFLWYIPVINLLIGVIGLASLLRGKKVIYYIAFISIGLVSILGYIYKPSITPDHIWASRRWVSVSFPLVTILASYGISFIANKLKVKSIRWSIILLFSLFTISFSLHQTRAYIFNAMLENYDRGYKEIINIIPTNSVIFTDEAQLASPLNYIYSRHTYLLYTKDYNERLSSRLENLLASINRPVYFIGKIPDFNKNNRISFEQVFTTNLTGDYLEKITGNFPSKVYKRDYFIPIYNTKLNEEEVLYSWLPTNKNAFFTENGYKTDQDTLASNGNEGFLVYGSYLKLYEGKYNLKIKLKLTKPISNRQVGHVDIVYDKGKKQIAKLPLDQEFFDKGILTMSKDFSLASPVQDIEFRVFTNNKVYLEVERITLTKHIK